MSYGSLLYNENGDLIFDGVDCLYLASSGFCTKFPWQRGSGLITNRSVIQTQGGSASVGQWSWIAANTPSTYVGDFYQSVSSTSTSFVTQGGTNSFFDSVFSVNDLPFVKIPPEGILQMEHLNSAIPDFPQGSNLVVSTPTPASALGYKVFSPTVPPSGETHGMQIYSAAGAVVFDSRNPILGIDFFEISLAQVQNILLNNQTLDLTLPKATPNALVHSPDWMAFTAHQTTDGCGRWIKITQPTNTTIRLSRHSIGRNTNVCNNVYNNYQPLTLLVSR